ncbi:MAG: PspA/IM30 family protein [Beijerinckiaceae bacterium]
MFRLFSTLIRGAAAEAEDKVFDANAIRILEQQLRDAAQSLEHARKELACAMAYRSGEARAVEACEKRIVELEPAIREAIAANRTDLAEDAAAAVASAEDEIRERREAMVRFETDINRLRRLVDDSRQRLLELRRGLETTRASEALRRAGANGQRAVLAGTGALREAESTLARIRQNQTKDDDLSAALDELDRHTIGNDLNKRMAEAGLGPKRSTTAADVLARFTSNAAETRSGIPSA